ncbi:MAE_28990/MAE_18760 family HEPN-like nuclease [Pantoea agglomerans]|uniref:MAE_28990/MAE_18760 family HEPN-like nuclease n=1 Tax=Enterobacter agglomerans TaxID=549 RepID=UPI0016543DF3|nr:MAE_28990/MAE_18760 family HEPN-like nuclease [Pantoea agglomerans]
MDCAAEYNEKFDEILSLVDLAEDDEHPLSHVQMNAVCRSGLVLLCGYFEGYLREMCKEFVERLNDATLSAKKLPTSILSEHSLHCLEKFQKKDFQPFSRFVLALSEDGTIDLNPKKLSATNANPTVDNLERLFSNFDMPLILDRLTLEDFEVDEMYNFESHVHPSMFSSISSVVGGDPDNRDEIIRLIEEKWPSKRKRRRVGYIALIDELLKKRNRIAHGEGEVAIATSDLREFTVSVRALCSKLSSILDSKLNHLIS